MADVEPIYTPTTPPVNEGDIRRWIFEELIRLSGVMEQMKYVPVFYVEPKTPEEGALYTFPGGGGAYTPGAGAGTYIYRSGAWVLIV